MKKYIVTGGAGFIGSHLTDALIERGDSVTVIDNLSSSRRENINSKADFREADIRDLSTLQKIIEEVKPDGIFHMAAVVSVQFSLEHPEETYEINVTGTKNISTAARQGIQSARIVFSSSAAVYGDGNSDTEGEIAIAETAPLRPKSPYGEHKKEGEQYATIALRYFNVYGPRQRGDSAYAGVIARFLEMTKQGKSLTVFGDGSQTRDFINVNDVVAANIAAMESGLSNEVINVGSGRATSVLEIADIFGGQIEHKPPRIEPKNSLADISKAKELLNWEPKVELKQGIALLRNML